MNHSSTDCYDDKQLLLLIENELSDRQSANALSHLDGCGACRERLERLAADRDFWQTTAKSLRDAWPHSVEGHGVDSQQPLSPVLKALLGPSDDPHSLGRIGRFEIIGVVGSGGMGTVLKARDVDIDRIVALKLPAAHLMESPDSLRRVEREARSAATIRHAGIIEIYQVDRWREIPYLVMPYHTGPSLRQRIDRDGPMELLDAIRIARQTAEALAAAHEHGVVHRDVKPANILLGKGTERAVLTDFGIAKIVTDQAVTASGVIVGTPAFLSPEQAIGGQVTPQSDLFALGSVLWSMLAGRPPFIDLPTHTVVSFIATGAMPSIEKYRADVPGWVCRLMQWLHQLEPENRPESAFKCAEILTACEQYLMDPVLHELPDRLLQPEPRVHRRRRMLLAFAAICLLVGGIGQVAGRWIQHQSFMAMPLLPVIWYPPSANGQSIAELQLLIGEMERELDSIVGALSEVSSSPAPTESQVPPLITPPSE